MQYVINTGKFFSRVICMWYESENLFITLNSIRAENIEKPDCAQEYTLKSSEPEQKIQQIKFYF